MNRLRVRDEIGQVVVITTGAMLSLLLAVGMVFDVGMILEERRQLQNAVDAAALAAAVAERDTPAQTTARTETYLLANGFDTSDPDLTVTIDRNYATDQVEVTATYAVPTAFFRVINVNSKTITVRAVGKAEPVVGAGDFAFVALNDTACDAFRKSGTSDIEITNGGIMVNSNCSPNAGRAHGNGGIVASRVDYYSAGGFQIQGSANVTPAPQPISSRLTDPLDGLAIPSEPTSPDSGGTAGSPSTQTITSSTTLSPGVYWGGLHLSGNATITLDPGVYVMAGGGFTSAGNGLIQGSGVMIYITSHPDPGDCGFVNLTGGKDLALTPPTSGVYEHITFWQDEDCTDDFRYRGGHSGTSGVIYTPGAKFDVSGGGDMGATQVIADTVHVSGNSDFSINFTGYVGGGGTGDISLAE